ncbi:DUF4279 domain-containing protein [Amycolatopsis taiwanensis]|uniref:DUF4279 domain-containing protein n=1 Tax=Amycolatopsis taiwanensis TaxID=342230 RepID=UPI003CCC0712
MFSCRVTAAEMTARLLVEPDEIRTMGSRWPDPPRPWAHQWAVYCREPGLQVAEQIACVMNRLLPRRMSTAEAAPPPRVQAVVGALR